MDKVNNIIIQALDYYDIEGLWDSLSDKIHVQVQGLHMFTGLFSQAETFKNDSFVVTRKEHKIWSSMIWFWVLTLPFIHE